MAEKRHLKVIGSAPSEELTPTHSRSHWLLLGAFLIVLLWLPLAMLGLWGSRLLASAIVARATAAPASSLGLLLQVSFIVPILGSFVLAAYLGGLLVVRFGPIRRRREALIAGGLAGASIASLAAAQGALRPWQIGAAAYAVLVLAGALSAAWGGGRGRRMYYADSVTGPPPS